MVSTQEMHCYARKEHGKEQHVSNVQRRMVRVSIARLGIDDLKVQVRSNIIIIILIIPFHCDLSVEYLVTYAAIADGTHLDNDRIDTEHGRTVARD